MPRTKRLHIARNDVRTLTELALLTEDRSDEEQDALVRTCVKLDNAGVPCGEARTWEIAAAVTRDCNV